MYLNDETTYLVGIKVSDIPRVTQSSNYYIIFDRSQSMWWAMEKVGETIKRLLRSMMPGDSVSIGWFTTEGQHRFSVKGHLLTESSFEILDKTVDNLASVIGLTSFSGILHDTVEVISELKHFNKSNKVIFLTDGHQVADDLKLEIKRTKEALKLLGADVDTFSFIGYGSYYNRPMLSEYAELVGGQVIHLDNIEDFYDSARQRIGDVNAILVNNLGSSPIGLTVDGAIKLKPMGGDMWKIPPEVTEVWSIKEEPEGEEHPFHLAPIYGYAYVHAVAQDREKTLHFLSKVGDKFLIDVVANAYTSDEWGLAANFIKDAIWSTSSRFTYGKVMNYLPPADAFSLIDLIETLETSNAHLWPGLLHYKKAGVPSQTKSGYPEFIPFSNQMARMEFQGHENRGNISVKVTTKGAIVIPDEGIKLGLPRTFETFITRAYNIVVDGTLHLKEMPVTLSDTTVAELKGFGVDMEDLSTYHAINLASMPLMNRLTAREYADAPVLTIMVERENILKAYMKVYKYLLNALNPDKIQLDSTLSIDQQKYLRTLGVMPYGYSPPSEKGTPVDYYMARTFKVKQKGWSALPSVEDVQSGKAKNEPALHMLEALRQAGGYTIEELNKAILVNKMATREITNYIQRTRFAVILGGMWFNELEDDKLGPFTFERGETKVYY